LCVNKSQFVPVIFEPPCMFASSFLLLNSSVFFLNLGAVRSDDFYSDNDKLEMRKIVILRLFNNGVSNSELMQSRIKFY
jgi:hypothetical protein